jgi:hypothetical protein
MYQNKALMSILISNILMGQLDGQLSNTYDLSFYKFYKFTKDKCLGNR